MKQLQSRFWLYLTVQTALFSVLGCVVAALASSDFSAALLIISLLLFVIGIFGCTNHSISYSGFYETQPRTASWAETALPHTETLHIVREPRIQTTCSHPHMLATALSGLVLFFLCLV